MMTVKQSLADTAARHGSLRERVITNGELIEIEDALGTARTRCAALAMCSEALDKEHRDAVDFLARDADHIINLAIDMIDALRNVEGNTHG
ncbi:MAG: hypothetical protein ACOH2N_04630 [Devosia sp.]